MIQYFPKPFQSFGGDINVKEDLSNYATKTDLKIYHISMLVVFLYLIVFCFYKSDFC